MAMGDLAGADAALEEFDKFSGFAPLNIISSASFTDFAGRADLAEENFKKTLDATGQLNLRLTDANGKFLTAPWSR